MLFYVTFYQNILKKIKMHLNNCCSNTCNMDTVFLKVHVEVVSLAAQLDGDFLLSALGRAVTEGHWLVFNHCHLLHQWDDKVLSYINQLFSPHKGQPPQHNDVIVM